MSRLAKPLVVAALALWAVSSAPRAASPQGEDVRRKDEVAPTLLRISQELGRLEEKGKARVSVSLRGRSYLGGVYLGDGLIATPWVEGLERGQTGTCWSGRRAYRIVAIGQGRLRLASLFKLRDWPQRVEPAKAEIAADDWREKSGPLVCLCARRGTRLVLLGRGLTLRNPVQTKGAKPTSFTGFYRLADPEVRPGSVAITVGGKMIGMVTELVRNPRSNGASGRRTAQPTKQGDKGDAKRDPDKGDAKRDPDKQASAKSASPQRGTNRKGRESRRTLVVSAPWLLAMARVEAAKPLPKLQPGLGLRLGRRSDGGFSISFVCAGAPAERAGVQRNDRWVRINGARFESEEQLRCLLRGAGEEVVVEYRRGASSELRRLRIIPN